MEELVAVLQLVKLDHLIKNDNQTADWCDVLSPGEKQRINLARVFYHKPTYVLLDEATSSISEDMEAEIYHLLALHNITAISVGHRAVLHKYHNMLLTLKDINNVEFSWKLTNILV